MEKGTYINMPYAFSDIIRTWTGTCLGGVASSEIVPLLGLKEPDGPGEEARGDQVEEASGDDKEDLHFRGCATPGEG